MERVREKSRRVREFLIGAFDSLPARLRASRNTASHSCIPVSHVEEDQEHDKSNGPAD